MANPNKVLLNNPFNRPTWMYPADLGSVGQEPYIVFQVRDAVAAGGAAKGTIALYMPPTVKVTYNAQYETMEMPIDQLLAMGEGVAHIGGLIDGEDWKGAGLALGKSVLDNVHRGGAKIIDQLTGANAEAFVERAQGKIVNPHMATLFKGIEPRTFTFDFQMFAKSADESEAIRNIIHVFKYAMHPGTKDVGGGAGRRFFTYPENFAIGLFSPEDRYLYKISLCALTSMNVDYAGSSVPSFFYANGAPVHVTMSLAFTEHEIMTKARIAQGF